MPSKFWLLSFFCVRRTIDVWVHWFLLKVVELGGYKETRGESFAAGGWSFRLGNHFSNDTRANSFAAFANCEVIAVRNGDRLLQRDF